MSAKSALEANGARHGFVFCIVQSLREGLLTALERRHKRLKRIRPISVLFLVNEPDGCADVAAESPNEMRQAAAALLLLRAESNEHIFEIRDASLKCCIGTTQLCPTRLSYLSITRHSKGDFPIWKLIHVRSLLRTARTTTSPNLPPPKPTTWHKSGIQRTASMSAAV